MDILNIKEEFNRRISVAREHFISKIDGQSFIYQIKYNQASSFIADQNPNIDDTKYSYIKSDYIAYGDNDPSSTAQRIIDAYNTSNLKLSEIERVRRQKLLILTAENAAVVFNDLNNDINNIINN